MANFFNFFFFIHRHAIRDLFRSFSKKITIFITIFISVFILFVISTLNLSINKEIQSNTKAILGGDAEIESPNKILSDSILQQIDTFATVSINTNIASMVSNKNLKEPKTSFVQLRAIDSQYPLYGDFITTNPEGLNNFITSSNQAIINENLSVNLQLKEGDKIYIRNQEFYVQSIIKEMPDLGGAGLFGDLVVISQLGLEGLAINSSENFLEYEYRIKFDENISLTTARENLQSIFLDSPDTRIRYPENSSNFIQRTLDNFANFLSLISLAAILIAGIGIANTIIAYINQNYTAIAVQKSLGLNTFYIQSILGYQIFMITFVITLIAFLLSGVTPFLVNQILPTGINFTLSSVYSFGVYLKITTISFLAIGIFLTPALNSIQLLSANSLFRNTFEHVSFNFSKKSTFLIIVLIILLILIFTWGVRLWQYHILFIFGFLFTIFLFYKLFKLMSLILKKINISNSLNFVLAKRSITSHQSIGPLMLTTLGIGLTLLISILLIASSFQNLIQKSLDQQAPDYFFIGIDQNNVESFKNYIYAVDQLSELEIVPLATAKLKLINGIDPNTYITRDNSSSWVIRGERRISWVEKPSENNPIIEGQWWEDNPFEEMYISFDADAAKDLGIQINDVITLSIYGRDIEGVVKNFREVDYSDFTINFAMLLNTNFANKIPHEYLSTVKLDKKEGFKEFALLEKFPNISSIKVASYAKKINQLLSKVNLAVVAIATIIILVGLLVISSAILVQGKNKTYHNLIFKIMGISQSLIIQFSLIEFFILFFMTVLITLPVSLITSFLVVTKIFSINWMNNSWSIQLNLIGWVYFLTGLLISILMVRDILRNLNPRVYPLIRNS